MGCTIDIMNPTAYRPRPNDIKTLLGIRIFPAIRIEMDYPCMEQMTLDEASLTTFRRSCIIG